MTGRIGSADEIRKGLESATRAGQRLTYVFQCVPGRADNLTEREPQLVMKVMDEGNAAADRLGARIIAVYLSDPILQTLRTRRLVFRRVEAVRQVVDPLMDSEARLLTAGIQESSEDSGQGLPLAVTRVSLPILRVHEEFRQLRYEGVAKIVEVASGTLPGIAVMDDVVPVLRATCSVIDGHADWSRRVDSSEDVPQGGVVAFANSQLLRRQ